MNLGIKSLMNEIAHKNNNLRVISEAEKEHLQNILLMMLLDIQKACESANIEYFLNGGTLLGAIRHKGFIPWDDDIDIAMTRDNWERFKRTFSEIMDSKYTLNGPNIRGIDSHDVWAKVYLKGTELVEMQDVATPFPKNFSIDIFIIDYMADTKIGQKFDLAIANFIRLAASSQMYFRYNNDIMESFMRSSKKVYAIFFLRRCFGALFALIPHRILVNAHDKWISRHNDSKKIDKNHKHYVRFFKKIDRAEWYDGTEKTDFCNTKQPVPKLANECLNNQYGSTYMQLPPEEKRELHVIVGLDFGKY